MTTPHSPPLVQAAELMGEMADATQLAAIAALKLEMEGLAVLFGGEAGPQTGALSEDEVRAQDAATEAEFDNMPV
jgi:hypothetical protein